MPSRWRCGFSFRCYLLRFCTQPVEKLIRIAENGLYSGKVGIDIADIYGHFEGELTARSQLIIHATGKVSGKIRYGIEGSMLGVHRFTTTTPMNDPVADTQRVAGMVLGYVTKMGISPVIVEAMSETRDVRWLGTKEAAAMNLVTNPMGRP